MFCRGIALCGTRGIGSLVFSAGSGGVPLISSLALGRVVWIVRRGLGGRGCRSLRSICTGGCGGQATAPVAGDGLEVAELVPALAGRPLDGLGIACQLAVAVVEGYPGLAETRIRPYFFVR